MNFKKAGASEDEPPTLHQSVLREFSVPILAEIRAYRRTGQIGVIRNLTIDTFTLAAQALTQSFQTDPHSPFPSSVTQGTAPPSAVPFPCFCNLQVTRRVGANRKRGSQFDVMPVTAGPYVSGNIAVWRTGRRGSYVNDMVGNSARLSSRYHCGLGRRAWIWADAPD
jgi:hypothetical protein